MIKVLGLSLYGDLAASHRYRLSQYKPYLAENGIDLTINSLLNNDYLIAKFNKRSISILQVFYSYFQRFLFLSKNKNYDLIIIQAELSPLIPFFIENFFISVPFIYDYDDAFYLKYSSGKLALCKFYLESKFDKVMKSASAVSAGNHILESYASQFNKNTFYLPTVVDTERFKPFLNLNPSNVFTIGWIGSPSTEIYLSLVRDALIDLSKHINFKFIVIGGKAPNLPNVNVIEYPWKEENEIELISQFNVGIMPLPDNSWAKGKCAFKLIQYLSCEIPVIASPVGANIKVVSNNCGFLASTREEWLNAFKFIYNNPISALEMGKKGRKKILDNYSLKNNAPILATAIKNCLL